MVYHENPVFLAEGLSTAYVNCQQGLLRKSSIFSRGPNSCLCLGTACWVRPTISRYVISGATVPSSGGTTGRWRTGSCSPSGGWPGSPSLRYKPKPDYGILTNILNSIPWSRQSGLLTYNQTYTYTKYIQCNSLS